MKRIDILVPKLGMDTTEATVTFWLAAEGDSIEVGSPLVELETEKTNFVVESEIKGTLAKIVRQQGSTVPVGEVLAILETE